MVMLIIHVGVSERELLVFTGHGSSPPMKLIYISLTLKWLNLTLLVKLSYNSLP